VKGIGSTFGWDYSLHKGFINGAKFLFAGHVNLHRFQNFHGGYIFIKDLSRIVCNPKGK
jgi:hypothetical protein